MNVIQYGFDSSESGVVSRYNVVSEEYSGKRLIFNTLTQNLAEVTHEEFDQLISGEDPTSSFRELGLLVSRDTNEVDLALELHRQLRQTEGVGLCLMVVPTLACNLRCRYCFNGIGHAKGDLTTAISDAISLARRELREGEPLRVTWYGGEHYCPVKSRIESAGWGHRVSCRGSRTAAKPVKWAFSRIG